jgi:hypothetical protein
MYVREFPADLFGGFDAVFLRHPEVHEHYIGRIFRQPVEQFFAVIGFQDKGDIGIWPEGKDYALPENLVVIGNSHLNEAHSRLVFSDTEGGLRIRTPLPLP